MSATLAIRTLIGVPGLLSLSIADGPLGRNPRERCEVCQNLLFFIHPQIGSGARALPIAVGHESRLFSQTSRVSLPQTQWAKKCRRWCVRCAIPDRVLTISLARAPAFVTTTR